MDDLVHLDTSCLKNQKKILDKICLKIHFVFLFKYAEPLPLQVEPLPLQVEALPLHVEVLVLHVEALVLQKKACSPLCARSASPVIYNNVIFVRLAWKEIKKLTAKPNLEHRPHTVLLPLHLKCETIVEEAHLPPSYHIYMPYLL